MNFYIENLPERLKTHIVSFSKRYGAEYSVDGQKLNVQLSLNDEIGFNENTLFYIKEVDIFRLLVKWIHATKTKKGLIYSEKRRFETFGIMLDFSRNEVMHLDGIKEYLNYIAGFGVDRILLYLEDTYEVKEYPYMGYFRGRYTGEELKEIDEYAASFGIETVVCMQTLGHMAHFLRWHSELRDTTNVLLADEEKTYEFIERCIKVIAENVSSPYIHIGMDEAFNLGGGAYKAKFGEIDAGELFVKHLNKVVKICENAGKKPVIWGDMLVVLSSKTGSCVDETAVIREELVKKLPDVEIVYWDYYSPLESRYSNMLDIYKKTGKKIWFAGGIWTWETFTYGDMRTKQTTKPAIDACLKNGIKDVFATSWVNPGGFCPHMSGLYGVAVWSNLVFDSECGTPDEEFEMVTGEKGEDFCFLNNLDAPEILPHQNLSNPDQQPSSAVMSFLFQSVLCGLFDQVTEGYDLSGYYQLCAERISKVHSEKFKELFKHYEVMAQALSLKANLGNIIYQAYTDRNKDKLSKIVEKTIPELIKCMENLIKSHRCVWHKYNKPYGFDSVRNHYAGVIADCYDSKKTIEEYLEGKIDSILQLEQQRLPYKHDFSHNETGFVSDVEYSNVYGVSRG